METLIIFIIAFGLAMDCFAIAITNSAVSGAVHPGVPLKTSLVFAVSHLLLLMLGFWAGERFLPVLQDYGQWIAVSVLIVVGLKMISDAIRRRPESKVFDINNTRVIVLLSLAAAMDAFLCGLALGILGAGLTTAALFVGLTVWLFTLSGLAGGHRLGLGFVKPTAIFGGVCMLIAAIHYLLPLVLAAGI